VSNCLESSGRYVQQAPVQRPLTRGRHRRREAPPVPSPVARWSERGAAGVGWGFVRPAAPVTVVEHSTTPAVVQAPDAGSRGDARVVAPPVNLAPPVALRAS